MAIWSRDSAVRASAAGTGGRVRPVPAIERLEGRAYWSAGPLPRIVTTDGLPPDALGDLGALGGATSLADLVPSFAGDLATTVIIGQKAKSKIAVVVTNAGSATSDGDSVVTLFASADQNLDVGTDTLLSEQTKRLRIKPAKHKAVKFNLAAAFNALPANTYFILARVTDSAANSRTAVFSHTVTIEAPSVDVTPAFGDLPVSLTPSKKTAVPVTVSSVGNTVAKGNLTIVVSASLNNVAGDGDEQQLATLTKKVGLKPTKSKTFKLKFVTPTNLAAGTYFFTATLQPAFTETVTGNDAVVSTGTFSVA